MILIGEIRDEETATIAVKAALTGHLVLTTLHSRDALTVIQRVEKPRYFPDLLSETLNLIVPQKLVADSADITGEEKLQKLPWNELHGRTPLYEILHLNRSLESHPENVGPALLEGIEGVYFRGIGNCGLYGTKNHGYKGTASASGRFLTGAKKS